MLLVGCAATPTTPDESVFSPLREALGERPEAWVVTGTYRDGAGPGEFVDGFVHDGRFSRVHTSSLPGGEGFDGQEQWFLPIDGLARPDGGRSAREAMTTAAVLSGCWMDGVIDVLRRGPRAFDLAIGDEPVGTLHLDRETLLPRQLDFVREGSACWLEFEEWEPAGEFQFPRRLELWNDRGRMALWKVAEVSVEEPTLAPPPVPVDHYFQETSSEISVRLAGARMVAAVATQGDVGWWLIDTGAASSAVDINIAERHDWPVVGEATLVGVGGRAVAGLRRTGPLSLGAFRFEGLPMIATDMSGLTQSLGMPISGVLGSDVLARCVLDLDFRSERGRVIDPDHWAAPSEAEPVLLDGGVPILRVGFAPEHEAWMRLDTGSEDTLTFHGPVVDELGLALHRTDLRTVYIRGVGGQIMGDRGAHPWIRLAEQRYNGYPVTYLRHSRGGFSRRDLGGTVGAGLLADRQVVLALPHSAVVID